MPFFTMVSLEKSCKAQVAAMSMGTRLIELSPNLTEHAAGQFDRRTDDCVGWPALLTMLDRIDPSYRN